MEAEERTRPDAESDDPTHRVVAPPAGDHDARADTDGREARAHERCAHHPSRAAVARCEMCDEPVCLTCAVPVRGRVLGPGCLAAELGDPALTDPPELDRSGAGSWAAVAGAVVALLGTAGAWTRTGAGDRLFGAWVSDVRWSMAAAVAATLLVPIAWWLRARGSQTASIITAILGIVVITASVLAVAFPPPLQAASWAPWVAAAGGAIACAGVVANLVVGRHPTQGV